MRRPERWEGKDLPVGEWLNRVSESAQDIMRTAGRIRAKESNISELKDKYSELKKWMKKIPKELE